MTKEVDATVMAETFAKTIARIAEFAVDLAETLHKDLGLPYQGPSSLKKPMQKKRARSERDPNEPKRPLSAYMLYGTHVRDELKNRGEPQPNMKDIGDMWGKLDEKEKEKYNIEALSQKELYDKQMIDYKAGKLGNAIVSEMTDSDIEDVLPPKLQSSV